MKTQNIILLGVGGAAAVGGIWWLAKRPQGPLAQDVFAGIMGVLIIAYYLKPDGTYLQVMTGHRMVEGGTYSINVSEPCVLDYDGYHYELQAGWNTIIWKKTA